MKMKSLKFTTKIRLQKKDHERTELYRNQNEKYKLLANTLNDEQVEMLDDFEDSWIELSGYDEKHAIMDGCKLAFSSIQSILKK